MSAQPGWYAQPDGSERYWDGQSWTQQTRAMPAVARFEQPPPPPDPGLTSGPARPFYKSKPFIATAAAVAVILIATAFWGGGGGQPEAAPAPGPTVTATVTAEPAEQPSAEASPPAVETAEPAPSDEPAPEEPAPEEEAETFTMPKVVGMNLQYAQDLLQSLGSWVMDQEDASGLGRVQVLDSNWKVCTQKPKAGKVIPVDTVVILGAVKLDEKCP